MSDLVEVVRAPLTPLHFFADEAAHRDGQATEALFLSFNVDLSFLESRLLDLCRQAGARVTVVADADVWAPDVRAITRAGVRYHVGLVAANGAFHPKVSLIVGPKRAVAIIGSGNLGMGGWQSNAELATVMTATLEAAPLAMLDLRDVLATLAERPELEPTSTSAIQRSVSQLTGLLTNTAELVDTGHRVAASWDQPLIEQIPQGAPVRELRLSAAFYDRGSIAVRRLLERLQPLHVRVAIQPGQTVIDPAALVRVLDDYSSSGDAEYEVLVDRESRYRHGKLIEWTVDGARMTLTGSPNLSQAALLATPPFGNFEVAVIAPTSSTLFPGGESTERPAEIPARAGLAPGEGMSGRGPVIVSALLTHDALSLRLARLSKPIIVEISAFADPDSWRAVTSVPANQLMVELPPNCMGGDRVRLAWTDEVGLERRSAPVYVTDRLSVERRPVGRTHDPKIRNAALTDLWGEDLSFLQSVFDELRAFTEDRDGIARGREKPTPAPGHATAAQHAVRQDSATWLWLREQSVDVLGPAIGPYALGLPPLAAGTRSAAPDWTDVLAVDEEADLDAEVDQEEDDQREGAPEPTEARPDHTESPLAVRRARRRWCVKAAAISPDTAIQYRLLLLRLTLRLWVLGNWDEGDLEPVRLIARLTSALRDEDAAANSPELNTRIGSLAAVALILVRPKEIKDSGEQLDLYRRLRDDVADLLVAGEDQAIESFFDGLIDEGDLEVKMHDARGLIEDAMGGDYLGELERDLFLENATKAVRRPAQNLLHLVADVPRARLERLALELIGRVENHPGVGIWVSNLEDDWVLAAWNAPELVRVAPYPNGSLRWRCHRLRALATPSSIAFEEFRGQKPELGPSRSRQQAQAALARIGVTDPVPPGAAATT